MTQRLISITLLCTLLSSCSWFTPPKYDNNEYFFFAELEAHSRFLVEDCEDHNLAIKRIDAMMFRSETLQTYSYYLPHNSELYGSSKLINKQLVELRTRYHAEVPPSEIYCKIKAKTLIREIRRILTTTGKLQEVSE